MVIPDCQVKPGVPVDHLRWAGEHAARKKPDTIICIGDFADMPSLSSYDVGKKSFEGRTYKADVDAARSAMELFLSPIRSERERLRRNREKVWNPKLVLTLGNHENRIDRAVEYDRKYESLISINDLGYSEAGWDVVPYLAVRVIDGVAYSHYFTSGILGRPVTSARALLTKRHCSAVMGHVQRRDIAYDQCADGRSITGLFVGSFYQHDEDYLGPQGNKCWRGIWMLHVDPTNGSFDELPIPISFLERRYGTVTE